MRCFRFLATIVICVCASVCASATAVAQKRVALVIGNSAYQNVSKLPNPVNDAKGIADLLRKSGFDKVETLSDASGVQLRRAVREFTNVARDADVAIVFFAGHGIEVGGVNYLIPVDAKLSTDIDAEDEAVSLDRVVRALEPAKRLRMVILDACRDNPFVKSMQRTLATRSIGRGLAQVEPASSDTLIAFAAKAGSTAEDGSGGHSPFTAALIKHLPEPGLDIRIAFGRIRDEVLRSTSNRQEPFVYGSLGGTTLALVPPPAAAAPPASAPERLTIRRQAAPPAVDATDKLRHDYELAAHIGTKEAWDSFLALQSKGFYADLARAARAKVVAAERAEADAAVARTKADSAERNRAGNAPAERAKAEAAEALAAEAQRAKTEALEKAKAGVDDRGKQQAVAALPPDPAEITRSLQNELRRTGCYAGNVDAQWNAGSQRSLENFNRHAGLKIDVKTASLDALEAVKSKPSRVCPLTCERGYRAQGEQCVAIVCPEGQSAGNDGRCHARHKPAAKHAEPRHAAPRHQARPRRDCATSSQTASGSANVAMTCR